MNQNKNHKRIIMISALSFFCLSFANIVFAEERANISEETVLENEIVKLVNEERKNRGLLEIERSSILDEAAKMKVEDMIKNDYFAHTSPSGIDPWYWLGEVDYIYKYAGENLAMDFLSASSVHLAWMKSQTHKENILSPRYDEIGVAVEEGIINGKRTTIAVEFFGKPLQNTAYMSNTQRILGSFNSQLRVEETFVESMGGRNGDSEEVIIHASIYGDPLVASVGIGEKRVSMHRFDGGKYATILKKSEIEEADRKVVIYVEEKNGLKQFFQIPKDNFYLEKSRAQVAMSDEKKEIIKDEETEKKWMGASIKKEDFILGGMLLVCLTIIFQIWSLEMKTGRVIQVGGEGR